MAGVNAPMVCSPLHGKTRMAGMNAPMVCSPLPRKNNDAARNTNGAIKGAVTDDFLRSSGPSLIRNNVFPGVPSQSPARSGRRRVVPQKSISSLSPSLMSRRRLTGSQRGTLGESNDDELDPIITHIPDWDDATKMYPPSKARHSARKSRSSKSSGPQAVVGGDRRFSSGPEMHPSRNGRGMMNARGRQQKRKLNRYK